MRVIRNCGPVFCSDLIFVVADTFLASDYPAGGSPAATHFSCLAKKSKQKKRPLVRSPFGVPGVVRHKSGGETNSLRSDKFPLFIRFAPAATGYSQADCQTGSLRIARGWRWSESHSSPLSLKPKMAITMPKASHPRQCEASRKRSSAYESPLVTCSNRIKKGNLSERSEFISLPDLSTAPTGTPKGRRIAVAFFCLLFLAKQEK